MIISIIIHTQYQKFEKYLEKAKDEVNQKQKEMHEMALQTNIKRDNVLKELRESDFLDNWKSRNECLINQSLFHYPTVF